MKSQIYFEAIQLWRCLRSLSSQLPKRSTKFKGKGYIQLQINISECLLTHQNQPAFNKTTKKANAREDCIWLFKSNLLLCVTECGFKLCKWFCLNQCTPRLLTVCQGTYWWLKLRRDQKNMYNFRHANSAIGFGEISHVSKIMSDKIWGIVSLL